MAAWLLCIAPIVVDGDSLRCRNLGEVRLLAVDAPDYRRSRPCLGGYGDHVCSDTGARRAEQSLRAGIRLGPVKVLPVTKDRYGRTVARVKAGSRDLSCYQLERRAVRYIWRYDNGRQLHAVCPAVAR